MKKYSFMFTEYKKTKTNYWKLSDASKLAKLVKFIIKYGGYFHHTKCKTNKKDIWKKLCRSQENDGWFLCENASFYSVNSKQAENQCLKNYTL